jgi:general secretion pathway protein K
VLPDTLSIHQQQFAVELRDVGARLNVNHSSEAELRRLLVALRLDAALSDRLAQRIADWTDGDDLHRPRGAERDAYLKAGAPVLPTNRRLRDSGELRWILGITPVLHDRIAPFVTTVGSGRINLRTAPRPVLLALPGMTEEAVELIIRARREPWRPLDPDAIHKMLSTRARALMLPHLPELTARTVSATQEVEVRSTGWARDDRVRTQVTALVVRAGEDMLTSGRQLR